MGTGFRSKVVYLYRRYSIFHCINSACVREFRLATLPSLCGFWHGVLRFFANSRNHPGYALVSKATGHGFVHRLHWSVPRWGDTDATKCFDGRIAQVAIWNTTLPEDQVGSIYIQGLSFDIRTTADDALTNLQTGMVHYWVLNGGVSDSQGSNALAPSASCTATGI